MIDEEFDALDRDVADELRRYDEITHLLTE
jgi:hypothetical protein